MNSDDAIREIQKTGKPSDAALLEALRHTHRNLEAATGWFQVAMYSTTPALRDEFHEFSTSPWELVGPPTNLSPGLLRLLRESSRVAFAAGAFSETCQELNRRGYTTERIQQQLQ